LRKGFARNGGDGGGGGDGEKGLAATGVGGYWFLVLGDW